MTIFRFFSFGGEQQNNAYYVMKSQFLNTDEFNIFWQRTGHPLISSKIVCNKR